CLMKVSTKCLMKCLREEYKSFKILWVELYGWFRFLYVTERNDIGIRGCLDCETTLWHYKEGARPGFGTKSQESRACLEERYAEGNCCLMRKNEVTVTSTSGYGINEAWLFAELGRRDGE
ncbi:hypothetical protein Tco_1461887, partial [Tanacetum coccineum]